MRININFDDNLCVANIIHVLTIVDGLRLEVSNILYEDVNIKNSKMPDIFYLFLLFEILLQFIFIYFNNYFCI